MALAHLTLATRDVDKAAAFFTDALLWRRIERPNNIGRPAAWLEIAPGQELHLIEVADFAPSPFEAEFGRHIALAFPLAGFDGLKRRLLAGGARLIDPERPTPFARFFFRAPDGYVFEIVPAERQMETMAPGLNAVPTSLQVIADALGVNGDDGARPKCCPYRPARMISSLKGHNGAKIADADVFDCFFALSPTDVRPLRLLGSES